MKAMDKSFSEVLNMVQQIRPIVDPNTGFRKQLEEYGRKLEMIKSENLGHENYS